MSEYSSPRFRDGSYQPVDWTELLSDSRAPCREDGGANAPHWLLLLFAPVCRNGRALIHFCKPFEEFKGNLPAWQAGLEVLIKSVQV